ncbi:MAG: hypothetical protein QOH90_443, partial [Actinomycetota bacterium]|nr:hypothetical protein [Actinomycetota bacterium]
GIAGGMLTQKFVGSLGLLAGVLIALVLAMKIWQPSPSTAAYGKGAEGERLTGRPLDGLDGYVILHDRKIPGSKRNIDHVAIGPGGVFVVETKNYAGEVKVRGEELFVGGRRKTSVLEQTWGEAVAVQEALADRLTSLSIDVTPVLCIHGSQVQWAKVQGVHVVGPRGLRKLIRKAQPRLSTDDISNMSERAGRALRAS